MNLRHPPASRRVQISRGRVVTWVIFMAVSLSGSSLQARQDLARGALELRGLVPAAEPEDDVSNAGNCLI